MKILVFFPFSPEQIADFTDLAGSLGDHEVLHADSLLLGSARFAV